MEQTEPESLSQKKNHSKNTIFLLQRPFRLPVERSQGVFTKTSIACRIVFRLGLQFFAESIFR